MKDTSTRSFNTVSPMLGDRKRRNQKRKIFISLIAVISVLILLFTFLIFAEIFDWFDSGDNPSVPVDPDEREYENIIWNSADVHRGELILINSSFPYVFPDTPTKCLSLYTHRNQHDYVNSKGENKKVYSYYTQTSDTSAQLEETALAALNAWADDFFRATNEIDLFVYDNDGYRSKDDQHLLDQKNGTSYEGRTEHHTGMAVDLYIYTLEYQMFNLDHPTYASTYSWIYKNAHKYGFVLRYAADKSDITGVTDEKYHFRYVGVPHAAYMYENGLCLEEYLDLIRDSHSTKKENLKFSDAENDYEVYYVPASSDSVTEIPVPKDTSGNMTYSISGDNKEGFIVTITIKKG